MLVLTTFTPVTATRKEVIETAETSEDGKNGEGDEYPENLVQIPCIWYPITFWKKSIPVFVLLDSGSKVNAIYPTFT